MSSPAPNSNVSSAPAVAESPNLISFVFTSKLPPNCGVASSTTFLINGNPPAVDPL